MLCGNLICVVHLPEGCSAVFNPGELSGVFQSFWVWKIAKVAVMGSAAVIWGGWKGSSMLLVMIWTKNWHFPRWLQGFFFYRTVFRFLDQSADITVTNFTAEPVHFGIFSVVLMLHTNVDSSFVFISCLGPQAGHCTPWLILAPLGWGFPEFLMHPIKRLFSHSPRCGWVK